MNIDLKVPTKWRELTVPQLRIVADTFRMHLTKEEMLAVLLCRLTGIRIDIDRYTRKGVMSVTYQGRRYRVSDQQLSDLCGRFEWLFEDDPCDIANPTGVDGHLRTVKFGDWFQADAALYGLAKDRENGKPDTKAMSDALKLLGDTRKTVRIADETEFDMVLLWWNGVGNMLRELYPYVFTSEDKPKKEYSPFKNLQNIHLMLNAGRPQDNEAIDHCDLHDVLSSLNAKIEEAERMKKEMQKMKRK